MCSSLALTLQGKTVLSLTFGHHGCSTWHSRRDCSCQAYFAGACDSLLHILCFHVMWIRGYVFHIKTVKIHVQLASSCHVPGNQLHTSFWKHNLYSLHLCHLAPLTIFLERLMQFLMQLLEALSSNIQADMQQNRKSCIPCQLTAFLLPTLKVLKVNYFFFSVWRKYRVVLYTKIRTYICGIWTRALLSYVFLLPETFDPFVLKFRKFIYLLINMYIRMMVTRVNML